MAKVLRSSLATRCLGLFAVATALAVLALPACAPDRTMLVVRVQSNIAIPADLDSIRIIVSHAGKPLQSLPFSLTSGAHQLPLQVGLLSPSGGGMDVEISVSGLRGTVATVTQEAVTSFIKGKSLVLDMFLAAECEGFDCHDPNKTCGKGQVCVPKTIAAEVLPVFDPHPGSLDARDGGTGGADARDAAATDAAATDAADASAADVAGSGGGAGASGGAGGSGGATAGAGGGPIDAGPEVPACVPKTEDCFNGTDDDCDGMPDCADPDCTPTAVCVPRPSGDVGTTVPALCPPGFATPTSYGSNLQAGGTACTGCSCGGGAVTSCSSMLTTYTSQADCLAGVNGRAAASVSSTTPDCFTPDNNTPNVYGAGLSPWAVGTTPCVPSGAPVKPPASFATTSIFCKASRVSDVGKTGCAAGFVCAPKPASGACVLLADTAACPTGTKLSSVLYTSLQDGRTCSACSCTLKGASCDSLTLMMGSDYSCGVDMADIKAGAPTCMTKQANGVYTPGYQLLGTPTNGTCTPASTVSGTVTPVGGRALCCL
jgi:hypothetical protein